MLVSRPAPTSFSDMSSRSAAEDDPILSQVNPLAPATTCVNFRLIPRAAHDI